MKKTLFPLLLALAIASPALAITTVHFQSGNQLQVASAIRKDGIWTLTLLSGGTLRMREEVIRQVDNATVFEPDPGNRLSVEPVARPATGAPPAGTFEGGPGDADGPGRTGEEVKADLERSRMKAGDAPPAGVPVPERPALFKDGKPDFARPQEAPPKESGSSSAGNPGDAPIRGGVWSMKKRGGNQSASIPRPSDPAR